MQTTNAYVLKHANVYETQNLHRPRILQEQNKSYCGEFCVFKALIWRFVQLTTVGSDAAVVYNFVYNNKDNCPQLLTQQYWSQASSFHFTRDR